MKKTATMLFGTTAAISFKLKDAWETLFPKQSLHSSIPIELQVGIEYVSKAIPSKVSVEI